MQAQVQREQGEREVVAWRCDQLVDAGFARSVAANLASDSRYDLHALIDLVERGCPATLAERILAPLDTEDAA
jgi:hypothetical protein